MTAPKPNSAKVHFLHQERNRRSEALVEEQHGPDERGWVKFWRKALDTPALRAFDCLGLWAWMLLQAEHKPKRKTHGMRTVHLSPGQFTMSVNAVANDRGMSRSSLRRRMALFERDGLISTSGISANKAANAGIIVTLCHWSDFQNGESGCGQGSGQAAANPRPTAQEREEAGEEARDSELGTSSEIPQGAQQTYPKARFGPVDDFGRDEPASEPSPPAQPPPDNGREYAFKGRIVRLNQQDFDGWREAYHRIPDLRAELRSLDDFYSSNLGPGERRSWFNRCSNALRKKHLEALARESQPPGKPERWSGIL